MRLGDFDGSSDTTVLVSELADSSTGYARGPERALLAALLFDGMQSYISYTLAPTERSKSRHIEAYRWVTDRSNDYVFSFESVCDGLGIDAEYLRSGLMNSGTDLLSEAGKSRRNF